MSVDQADSLTAPERSRLVLVRHCESIWNAAGRIQGHGGPGLSSLGQLQAMRLAAALARRFADTHLIVSSDLARARETAAAILERLPAARLVLDPRLREIDLGSWTGKTFEELAREVPAEIEAWVRGEDRRHGGAETHAEMLTRVSRALRDAIAHEATASGRGTRPRRDTVIAVSHGGPIRLEVARLLGFAAGGYRALGAVANGAATVLDVHGLTEGVILARLQSYNEVMSDEL